MIGRVNHMIHHPSTSPLAVYRVDGCLAVPQFAFEPFCNHHRTRDAVHSLKRFPIISAPPALYLSYGGIDTHRA